MSNFFRLIYWKRDSINWLQNLCEMENMDTGTSLCFFWTICYNQHNYKQLNARLVETLQEEMNFNTGDEVDEVEKNGSNHIS